MLQHVITSNSTLARRTPVNPLSALMARVRNQMVYLSAKDVYSLCSTANSGDPLGFFADPEFMRALHGSFQRTDQTILSPFQVNVVTDTLQRAGLRVIAKDIVVPDHETASPETLLNALQAMYTNKRRDDRAITEICEMMTPLLPEFSTIHLSQAARLLSLLQTNDKNFLGRLGRRAAEIKDDLTPVDLTIITSSLAFSQVQPLVLYSLFKACEERVGDLKADDVILVLRGLNAAGPKFVATLSVFTEFALKSIEELDAVVLSHFVSCFVTLEYANKEHIEIVADAVADRSVDMPEREVIAAFEAMLKLDVMSAPVFSIFRDRILGLVSGMDVRNIFPVMDVCSQVPHDSANLMLALMDRAADRYMLFSSNMLGDILECLAQYPAAKTHRIVEAFGKHVQRRMDLLGPPPLSKCVHGLSMLGYADPQLYVEAALTNIRWGVKDYNILEPVLHGLCISGPADPKLVTMLGTYVRQMAKRMSLQEVERANRYMTSLQCSDEPVFRALAERVKIFVREVTPDTPQELVTLLERAAANPPPPRPERGRRQQSHRF